MSLITTLTIPQSLRFIEGYLNQTPYGVNLQCTKSTA
jgi:hypothetical protein